MEARIVERIAGRFIRDPVKFPDYEMDRLSAGVRQFYSELNPELLCSVLRSLCGNPQRSTLIQSASRLRLFNLFLEIHEMPTAIPATFALSILLKSAKLLEIETGIPPKPEVSAELELCRKLASMVLNCRHLFTRYVPPVLSESRNNVEENSHAIGWASKDDSVEMRESSVEIIEDDDVQIIDSQPIFEPEDDDVIIEEPQNNQSIGPSGDQPPTPRRSARLSGASISEVDVSVESQKSPEKIAESSKSRTGQKPTVEREPVPGTSKQMDVDVEMDVDSDSDSSVTPPPKSPVTIPTWSEFQPDHTASSTIATLSILRDTALVAAADAIGPVPKQGVRLTDDDIDKIVALFG